MSILDKKCRDTNCETCPIRYNILCIKGNRDKTLREMTQYQIKEVKNYIELNSAEIEHLEHEIKLHKIMINEQKNFLAKFTKILESEEEK